ncbi:hypothetical protein F4819DRAFT_503985 [Hypoxylon fuscum]|nr:hypothetical protein F4819DRAFT_503985 [Hypoxylon fuscum]
MDTEYYGYLWPSILMTDRKINNLFSNNAAYDWMPFRPYFTAFFLDSISYFVPEKSWDYNIIPDRVTAKFFTEAMRISDNSPASSLSALLTLLSSLAYYDQLPFLQKSGTADVISFVTTSYPQSWRGLATVIALLVAHSLICVVVLALFVTQTELTRLGNVWSCVSQVYGTETRDLIWDGTLSSDTKIQTLLDERDMAQRLVRISMMDYQERRCGPTSVRT